MGARLTRDADSEDSGLSDFDWIENKTLKLGQVSDFYLRECDDGLLGEDPRKEGSLISLIGFPNLEIPQEIPCYRELRSKRHKFKKRVKQVQIKLTKAETQSSEEENAELLGCVNPGLYINVLEEELPTLVKAQESRVRGGPGFAENAEQSPRERQRAKTEFEEFNIYGHSADSRFSESNLNPRRVKRKVMRASKSQSALVDKTVPVEVMLEEEKNQLRTEISIGYEDLGIDPFDDNDYAFVQDYDTLTKNKDIEYGEQPKGGEPLANAKRRRKSPRRSR